MTIKLDLQFKRSHLHSAHCSWAGSIWFWCWWLICWNVCLIFRFFFFLFRFASYLCWRWWNLLQLWTAAAQEIIKTKAVELHPEWFRSPRSNSITPQNQPLLVTVSSKYSLYISYFRCIFTSLTNQINDCSAPSGQMMNCKHFSCFLFFFKSSSPQGHLGCCPCCCCCGQLVWHETRITSKNNHLSAIKKVIACNNLIPGGDPETLSLCFCWVFFNSFLGFFVLLIFQIISWIFFFLQENSSCKHIFFSVVCLRTFTVLSVECKK